MENATVNIQSSVVNKSAANKAIVFQTDIISPSGKVVATTNSKQKIPASKDATISQKIKITRPDLWDIDDPQLYVAVIKVFVDKKQVDELQSPFGIRDAKFVAASGFWLNGKNIKIKGVCMHHDGGAVGAAVPLGVWKYRLSILKSIGVNAIRTSHNPRAPEFLALCDQMGFLVMEENFDTWNAKKSHAE
jgi:beta-galactosidase